VAGLAVVSLTAPQIAQAGASSFRAILGQISRPARATSAAGLSELMHIALRTIEVAVLPIAVACVAAAVIGGVVQVGGLPTPQALKPDFRRINPVNGMKNLLGPNLLFEALKAVVKVAVVGAVAALAILPGVKGLASIVGVTPGALAGIAGHTALGVAQRAGLAYVVIGLIDYGWKRWRNERQLRMTKQELRDELRQHGISAEVKAALRRRQMQLARARMMAAVPNADVVVANPTHFAVALSYDGSRTAPEVVAKGQDLVAAQIRRIAEENDVPVVSDPPLARSLHSSTEVGQLIPEELYAAVAGVLAFVYRMAGRQGLRRAS
jgi:flagellar biosynthetic protein FlhB